MVDLGFGQLNTGQPRERKSATPLQMPPGPPRQEALEVIARPDLAGLVEDLLAFGGRCQCGGL